MSEQNTNTTYRGIVYYKDGTTSVFSTESLIIAENARLCAVKLPTVETIWFEALDDGNGYSWDDHSLCWYPA